MKCNAEIEFLRIYKDFIYQFNMWDRNMAYCLQFCHKGIQYESNNERWLKKTFDLKLKRILRLAKNKVSEEKYEEFLESAEVCRKWRNVLVHGNWEWHEWLTPQIFYHAPEPYNKKGNISVQEFKEILNILKKTTDEFRSIRLELESKLSQQNAAADPGR